MNKNSTVKKYCFSYHNNPEPNKYISIKILVRDSALRINRLLLAKIDTGASITVFPAHKLGITMTEADFIKKYNPKCVRTTGFIKGNSALAYEWFIEEFKLDNIVFKDFPIHIIFSQDVQSVLIGYDFLKLFIIKINALKSEITFVETKISAVYNNTGISAKDIGMMYNSYINKLNISINDLEANYVNKQIKHIND